MRLLFLNLIKKISGGNQKGFAFITVSLLSSIVFAGARSYLDLTVSQARMARSSQNLLEAQAAAEAGMEEAAWECSYNSRTFSSANYWTISGANKTKTANLTNTSGAIVGTYTATATNWSSGSPLVTVTGTSASGGSSKTMTSKALFVPTSVFTASVKTQGQITLSGNAYTDSYRSASGAYGGTNRLTNGTTQTNSTSGSAISMSGNAKIKGNAGVGTGGGVSMSGNALITGTTSTGTANTFTNNTVPSSLTALSSSGAINLSSNSSQTITAGSYKYTSLSTSGNAALTISGNVTMYLTGATSFSNSGNSTITITSGSSLTIYMDGSLAISGNGVANSNGTTQPTSFQIYGTSTSTSFSISGNGATSGLISVPNAAVSVSGNGDIYGSVIANTFAASGNGGFHYDESLATTGPGSGLKLSWARRTA